MKRRGVSDGVVLAIASALCLVVGVIALLNFLAFDSAARGFRSAAKCTPAIDVEPVSTTDCLGQRDIRITGIATGRYGKVTAVDFLDGSNSYESHLAPGARETWVLQAGAPGSATTWHAKYTNLDVAGVDFATDDNPVAQQNLWTFFGFIGFGFALILGAASLAWKVMNRRTWIDG